MKGKKKALNNKYITDVVIPAGSNFDEFKPLNGVTIQEGPK